MFPIKNIIYSPLKLILLQGSCWECPRYSEVFYYHFHDLSKFFISFQPIKYTKLFLPKETLSDITILTDIYIICVNWVSRIRVVCQHTSGWTVWNRKLVFQIAILKQGRPDKDIFPIKNTIWSPLKLILLKGSRWECPKYSEVHLLFEHVKKGQTFI